MATTLSEVIAIGPTLKAYKFDVAFSRLPSGSPIKLPGRDVHLRVQSTDLPSNTGQPITIQLHGHTFQDPGIVDPTGQITFQLIETIDLKMIRFIEFLKSCVWESNTGVQGDMTGSNDRSFDVILRHADNQDNLLAGYKLNRCFWSGDNKGSFQSGSSDVVRPSLTFNYTWYELIN